VTRQSHFLLFLFSSSYYSSLRELLFFFFTLGKKTLFGLGNTLDKEAEEEEEEGRFYMA
jgi:hypothetical protein